MTSPLRAAIIAGAASALGFAEGHPLRSGGGGDAVAVAEALQNLRLQLVAIDPVIVDAVAASSFDGSPERRNLNLRLHLDPSVADLPATRLAPLLGGALERAWGFREFLAAGVSVQLWLGPRQQLPYDNSAKMDLAPVLEALDIPGARVFKKMLSVSARDLERHFGPRSDGAK
ncbi:hypothetical protein F1C58_14300 [Glaciihabitans sp. INWT7]|uniref:hypothetical protein n=1 Tax=Glaciihabitans sp. INWT7 TaxID=2596912 RepID=UPI00162AB557|nr:hypothetical protein [Glaciihabitans sp. INWT7]QNE47952.1 hypothetical protein F1C58_14300 [Glaciihabitans sp. INWT7]